MRAGTLAVSTVVALVLGSVARGQPPDLPGTYHSYNYERAYRQFLNSPYSYRSLSSLTPGYAVRQWTPFGIEGAYQQPGYQNQRITPHGYEAYSAVPGYGSYVGTPFSYNSFYVPGYQYYVLPAPPRP